MVGIGDMSGDVFGNGMLLSQHICLVAAFNHLHIFVDPNPDAGARPSRSAQRLFAMPRSSWTDYNAELISKGGGIFSRSAKSIPISPEMKKRFGIKAGPHAAEHADQPYPASAQIDLLWIGGIGTYVKASNESHSEVGDKANDGLRVDGRELQLSGGGRGRQPRASPSWPGSSTP